MPQDDLLEAHAEPEPQRPAAQPADRAGGELDRPHPPAVETHLGMHRPLAQAHRGRRGRDEALDGRLRRPPESREGVT